MDMQSNHSRSHQRLNPQSAFSLIELMMVVGIISMLAHMATVETEKLRIRTYRAEAYTAMRSGYQLAVTYGTADSGNYFNFEYGRTSYGTFLCAPNALGFSMPNCGDDLRGPRFRYHFNGGQGSYGVLAGAKLRKSRCASGYTAEEDLLAITNVAGYLSTFYNTWYTNWASNSSGKPQYSTFGVPFQIYDSVPCEYKVSP